MLYRITKPDAPPYIVDGLDQAQAEILPPVPDQKGAAVGGGGKPPPAPDPVDQWVPLHDGLDHLGGSIGEVTIMPLSEYAVMSAIPNELRPVRNTRTDQELTDDLIAAHNAAIAARTENEETNAH